MPKSEQEFERVRAESKERILSAAIEVFAKKGYAAASTSDIAKTANISVGLMYRYFSSKQELFESITEYAVAGLADAIRLLNSNGNPKEILIAMCQGMLQEMDNEEFINISMLMTQGLVSEDNPISQKILSHDKKMFAAAANLIRKGQEEGLFAGGDPAAKAALLFSSIQGMAMMKFLFKESFKTPSLSELTALLYQEAD